MKTEQVVKIYQLINRSKLTKMEETGKFKVIKIMKALKPVATAYEDFQKDAQEKLKDDDFEKMSTMMGKWQEEKENTTLTREERININTYFDKYYKALNKCLQEEIEKENDFAYEKLNEKEMGHFLSSNDFTVEEMMLMEEYIVDCNTSSEAAK